MMSAAQAKLVARIWAGGHYPHGDKLPVGGYDTPTVNACIKAGWFEPTGDKGTHANGKPFEYYRVSQAGLFALADFLRRDK